MKEPAALARILEATHRVRYTMVSEPETGSLLRTLAASKPGGRFLELGTGTGFATAWLLDGMDEKATLVTVDNDENVLNIAREHLGDDSRLSIVLADADQFIDSMAGQLFDLVFADTWAGKYHLLEEVLSLVAPGGVYVVDDLLPQLNWPEGHEQKVKPFIEEITGHSEFQSTFLHGGTGILIAVRRP